LDKTPAPSLLFAITVHLAGMVLIPAKCTVGARSAQLRSWHATVFKTNSKSAREWLKINRPECKQGGDKLAKTNANRALP